MIMNKRFSTLMTAGLLMLGALFSNANAAAPGDGVEAVTGNVKEFSGYYLLGDGTNGFLKGKEATIENTKFTVLEGTVKDEFTASETIDDEYFWTIEPQLTTGTAAGVTVTGFKFKNKKTNAYLTMADGTALEPAAKPTITVFSWYDTYDATNGFDMTSGKEIMMTTNGIILSSGNVSLGTSSPVAIKAYRAKAREIKADALNGIRGSFSFKAAGLETSIFAKNIKAFDVSNITTGFSETDVNKDIPAGVYFATSWGDLTGNAITTYEDFAKCTFIAIDPTTSLSKDDKDVKDGKNLGFVEVQGNDFNFFTSSATGEQQSKNKEVYVGNAAFKVETSEAYFANDKYSYAVTTVGNIRHLKEKGKTEQVTSANAAGIDVATVDTNVKKLTATVKATAGNVFTFGPNPISKVTRLLNSTGASIYNIRFESGKSEVEDEATEKGKYLSANFVTGTDYSLVAQGSAVADLNIPLYQFVISAVDTTQNIVTFRNREAGYEFNCELDTTTTAGVYQVTNATVSSAPAQFQVITVDKAGEYTEETAVGLTGKTITLIPATVDKFAGFAVRGENHDYIRLAFAKDENAEKLYVTVDETTNPAAPALAEVSDEEAAMFELVRNDAPSYLKNDYVMLDDKGKVKTMSGKDTVAYYTYNIRYQVNNLDWYYLKNTDLSLEQENAGSVPVAAHAFIIKENKNGSVSIMDKIAYNAKAIAFKTDKAEMSTAGVPYQNADAASVKLYIAQDIYGASLEAVPGHVAISAENGGYVSMDENRDARIAIKTAADVDLTFWLDTADVDNTLPSFYISKGVKDAAERLFLYYAADSADYVGGPDAKNPYKWSNGDNKMIFKAATLANSDTLVTTAKGQTVKVAMKQDADGTQAGLANFRYQIFKASDAEDAYVVRCGVQFLKNNNGELTLTGNVKDALRVYVDVQEAPTANEGVEVATVKVIAGEGKVTIAGAQGKKVVISNILGQVVANTVIASDNATIAAPQGVVVVAVEGEAAVKAIVK